MKFKTILLCLTALFIQNLIAQEKTSIIMEKAYKQAKTDNKNVFVIFKASWCGWCKIMEEKLNDEACKELFEDNFIITPLVVKESEENMHLVNPGAIDFLVKHNGEGQGIPFWLILNDKGELLANSLDSKGKNMGCPSNTYDVDLFIDILRKTSELKYKDLKTIENVFLNKKTYIETQVELKNIIETELVGEWVNIDSNTGDITRVVIENNNNELSINAFGRCHPIDCEWGEVKLHEIAASVEDDRNFVPFDYCIAVWEEFGFAATILKLTIETGPNPRLHIDNICIFRDNSERNDFHSFSILKKI